MDTPLHPNHQFFLDKFLRACQRDERVVAAFLFGSYTNGKPDEHSDLDLCLVTTDESYDDFVAQRDSFVRLLGEPLFMEDFDIPDILFLIFPDGSEVEVNYARESQLSHLFTERYKVLLDKKNITGNLSIHERETDIAGQTKKLRRFTYGFWHDFSHFVTAMGRDQLWWAQGQLEFLRSICVGLARLRNDFSDTEVEGEVYFKIEKAMPVEMLSPLQESLCPMERESMLRAGFLLAKYFKEVAEPLATEHDIRYPTELEALMIDRLHHVQ
jgi:predicted nucleotidyltransferase